MEMLNLHLANYVLQLAVDRGGQEPMVALKPICEAASLDWTGQLRRTQNNPQFNCRHISTVAEDGKQREMLCIPVRQIGMWLCTINANKVREDIRPKLIAFQEHLQVVIHDHLTGNLTNERIARLEQVVNQLMLIVEDLKEENEELRSQLRAGNILDRTLVSNAGRQLAAQKAIKKLIH